MSLWLNSDEFAFFNDQKRTPTSQDNQFKGINTILGEQIWENTQKSVEYDFINAWNASAPLLPQSAKY